MGETLPDRQIQIPPECRRFDLELPRYLEGEASTQVEGHAAQCGACRSVLEQLRGIQAAARQLPEESPSPKMWVQLRSRLRAEGLIHARRRRWASWLDQLTLPSRLIPASVIAVLAVATVLVVTSSHHSNMGTRLEMTSSSTPLQANYSAQEISVEHTVRQMAQAYHSQINFTDPDVREDYQKGIASLDNSIRECNETLQQAPDNLLARQYLMQAYAQKAAILASALEYQGR